MLYSENRVFRLRGCGAQPREKILCTARFLGKLCTPDDLPHLVGKRSSRPARSRGHGSRVSVLQHEGCEIERTCLRSTIATTRETRAAAAAQGRAPAPRAPPPCYTCTWKHARLSPAHALGVANEHCSNSAARCAFCAKRRAFSRRAPRREECKSPCAEGRHHL